MNKFEYGQRVLHNKTDLARIVGQDDETTYKIIYDNDREWVYADAGRLEPVSGWIPCSERMPDFGDTVLITNGKDTICDCRALFSPNKGSWGDMTGYNMTPTHWMPLPEPPK